MNGNYIIAFLWFFLHVTISAINDILVKKLGSNIPTFEIVFLRYLFSTIFLFPFFIKTNSYKLKYKFIGTHSIRGLLLFIGITTWSFCLNHTPIVNVTLMSFSIPIFFIILARLFLDEKIRARRFITTIIGFIGIVIITNPLNIKFNSFSILLVIGAILFASLDIINKRIVKKENTINMIFFSSFFTMLFGIIALQTTNWIRPSITDGFLCLFLGVGSNLMLYAMIKAFSLVDASSLAPIRYIEIIITGIAGYLFFNEKPTISFVIGAFIILACNMYLIRTENKEN